MDPYEYRRHADDVMTQVERHVKQGTAPVCHVTLLVDASSRYSCQGVEHALSDQLGVLGVHVTANTVGGRAGFECVIEGPPAALFGLLTDAFVRGGLQLKDPEMDRKQKMLKKFG